MLPQTVLVSTSGLYQMRSTVCLTNRQISTPLATDSAVDGERELRPGATRLPGSASHGIGLTTPPVSPSVVADSFSLSRRFSKTIGVDQRRPGSQSAVVRGPAPLPPSSSRDSVQVQGFTGSLRWCRPVPTSAPKLTRFRPT